MFGLDLVGHDKTGRSLDVRLPGGAFCGIVSERYGKHCKVWFNGNATRGSARKFENIEAALEFIRARRIKKGWAV